MRTDRRPILLANARLIDPARDLDGPGDVLIADGMIRDARRGIGAAGVPEGTDIINCAGKVVAPGLVDMRASLLLAIADATGTSLDWIATGRGRMGR